MGELENVEATSPGKLVLSLDQTRQAIVQQSPPGTINFIATFRKKHIIPQNC